MRQNVRSRSRIRKSTSPPRDSRRVAACLDSLTETVTLASLDTSSSTTTTGSMTTTRLTGTRLHSDPSMYKYCDRLRATCVDAADTMTRITAGIPAADRATVELPSGRTLTYNNAQDVLHLRFAINPLQPLPTTTIYSGDMDLDEPSAAPPKTSPAPLTAIFQSLWSRQLAAALHGARRVAIDVSQIWPELAESQNQLVQDIVFLACTLQNDLEVLYLVDYSAGRCQCGSNLGKNIRARDLMRKDGELYQAFHSHAGTDPESWEAEKQRKGDVIQGVGKVWREVFDLEALGWNDKHPGAIFAETFGEVIRLQQENWYGEGEKASTFKGVRVLIAEDEEVDGVNTTTMLGCGCGYK